MTIDDRWGLVITKLQDLYKLGDIADFESLDPKNMNFNSMAVGQLSEIQNRLEARLSINDKMRAYCRDLLEAVSYVLDHYPADRDLTVKREGTADSLQSQAQVHAAAAQRPAGRSHWTSQYNPSEPIEVGSEVAYKSKKTGEWIQCICTRVYGDGLRFEVKDPEPDEFGKPGGIFKCTSKEVILIPPVNAKKSQIPNYPVSTKVLARYPETTTFYPAVVCGSKRDGTCKLRFDGEEEIDKETEVERRLVLPYPSRR